MAIDRFEAVRRLVKVATGDEYGDFLAEEETRVRQVLTEIGLIQ